MAKKTVSNPEKAAQEASKVSKPGQKKEESSCCGMGSKSLMTMVAALIVGVIIGALVMYAAGGGQKVVKVTDGTTTQPVSPVTDTTALKAKVASFVRDNLLGDPSIEFKINEVSVLNNVYNMSFDIIQGGESVSSGAVFISDNNLILPQMVLNLDTPLPKPEAPTPQEIPKSDKPAVELFIMSFCPYGIQAAEAMAPVAQLLGNKADISLGYVIYSNYASQGGAEWSKYCLDENETYCSMHGIGELNEDVRQLCIQKYQKDKLWGYMSEVISAYNAREVSGSNIDEKWKTYAQAAGVDVAKVESCASGEAESLLSEQTVLNSLYGVQGSPTMIVNGVDASFARSPEGFKTGICDVFNSAPSECGQTLSGSSAAAPAGGCG